MNGDGELMVLVARPLIAAAFSGLIAAWVMPAEARQAAAARAAAGCRALGERHDHPADDDDNP